MQAGALAGGRVAVAGGVETFVDLGSDQSRVGQQPGDVVPDDGVEVVGADWLVDTDSSAFVAVVVPSPSTGSSRSSCWCYGSRCGSSRSRRPSRRPGLAAATGLCCCGRRTVCCRSDAARPGRRCPGSRSPARGCRSTRRGAAPRSCRRAVWNVPAVGLPGSAQVTSAPPWFCRKSRGRCRRGCAASPRSPSGPSGVCRCGWAHPAR